MATGSFGPQDLGRLSVVGRDDVEAGVILWDRFCVVGRRHEGERIVSVAVTDLHRVLGDAETHHRLELHLLDVANDAEDERTDLEIIAGANAALGPACVLVATGAWRGGVGGGGVGSAAKTP